MVENDCDYILTPYSLFKKITPFYLDNDSEGRELSDQSLLLLRPIGRGAKTSVLLLEVYICVDVPKQEFCPLSSGISRAKQCVKIAQENDIVNFEKIYQSIDDGKNLDMNKKTVVIPMPEDMYFEIQRSVIESWKNFGYSFGEVEV